MRWAICCTLLLVGCAARETPLETAEGAPKPALISMTSSFTVGTEQGAEVRRIVAQDGRITCEVRTRDGVRRGSVPQKDWRRLWEMLLAEDPFGRGGLDVEEEDREAGPYHRVRLELGHDFVEFTAQNKADLLIFASQAVVRRLRLSNAIADLVSRCATETVNGN